LAVVFAGLVGFLLFNLLTPQQMAEWGWRIPFIFGLLIAPVGYYIRRNVDETLDRSNVAHTSWTDDLRNVWQNQRRAFFASFALLAFGGGNFYIMFIYMPTFAVRELNLGLNAPFISTLVAGTLSACGAIFWAGRVDRGTSPRLLYGMATVTIILIAYPLYAWIVQTPTLAGLVAMQVALAIPGSVIVGLGIVMSASLFAPNVRASVLGFNFNVTNSIFGGLAPLMVSYAVVVTGNKAAAAYYIVGVALIGLVGVFLLPGRQQANEMQGRLAETGNATV
jgi:MHS family proline/betaine transporter-like MFS transporter